MKELKNLLEGILGCLGFIALIVVAIPLFVLRFIFLKWKWAKNLCEKGLNYLDDLLYKII